MWQLLLPGHNFLLLAQYFGLLLLKYLRQNLAQPELIKLPECLYLLQALYFDLEFAEVVDLQEPAELQGQWIFLQDFAGWNLSFQMYFQYLCLSWNLSQSL